MPVLSTLGAAIANVYGFTSGLIKDQYFNLVSLLLPGNGTNGAQNNTFLDGSSNTFTITRNGNTTQGTFSPFSQTGWSNYFSGSSSTWINAPDNAALELGSNNFTIECWIYATSSFSVTRIISSKYNHFVLGINTTPALTFSWYGTSSSSSIGTLVDTSINKWHHIAVCRSGSTLYMFQNGQQLTLTNSTITGTLNNDVTGPIIGGNSNQSGGSIISANDPWVGYVSNYRLTNGAALYTSGFTPSTSPLTTTSQGASASQVEWLTAQSNRFADNSDNQFTLTVAGSPSVTPFSPFAPTQSYSAAAVGGSGYFDGTGDYLSIADNAAWDFGTGQFMMEVAVYFTATSLPQTFIAQLDGLPGNGMYFRLTGSGLEFGFGDGAGSVSFAAALTIVSGAWYHFVVTRDSGNTLRLFSNGVLLGSSASFTKNLTGSTAELWLGRHQFTNWYLNGYMANVRISNGSIPTSYQTSSTTNGTLIFTPPSSPLTTTSQGATAGDVKLLCNFTNAGVVDATAKNVLETVGNAQISTTQSKWGGGSMYFDGTGDYLLINNNYLPVISASGDMTIEMWLYPTSTSSLQMLVAMAGGGSTSDFYFYISTGGLIGVETGSGYRDSATSIITANTWQHVALTKSGSTYKIYVGGTERTITGAGTMLTTLTNSALYIGAGNTGANLLTGYIDDLRVSNMLRYNGNFTPPSAPFPVQ